jgi:hypothetical protein
LGSRFRYRLYSTELDVDATVGVKADATRGDHGPGSTSLGSFNPLFPNSAYSEAIGLIGPTNTMDVDPSLRLQWRHGITLSMDSAFYWRQSIHDGLYGTALNVLKTGRLSTARYVGELSSVRLDWQAQRHFIYTAVFSHFSSGQFLEETPPGKDLDYFSSWVTFRF